MRLLDVLVRSNADKVRLVGVIEREKNGVKTELYFEFPDRFRSFLSETADPFIAAMLLPSMWAGERLESVPAVSPALSFNLSRIRDIFHTWYPELQRIEIEAPHRADEPVKKADHAATFFSGGVDSFYTLLKYQHGQEVLPAPLTHIIFMRGVENKLAQSRGVDESQRLVEEIAAETGVECIVGETNIRSEFHLHWERYYHGSGLASVALSLAGGLGYVCIPSAYSYNHMVRLGSTPLTDEMFSTERLRLIHDGSEATRAEKVERAVEWSPELVLRQLRVCIENEGGAYNCGECYKCVRTGVSLRAMGLWEQADAFPNKSTKHWRKVIAQDHLALNRENLNFAREKGGDAKLTALLDQVVRRQHIRTVVHEFIHNSPLRPLLPLVRRMRSMTR